jgi:phosphatidate cytidylyltransferase
LNQLAQRILAAAVAVPLLLLLTFWHEPMPFQVAVLLVLTAAFLEMGRMARAKSAALLYFSGLYFLFLFWMGSSGIRFLERLSLPGLLVAGLMLLFLEFTVLRRPLPEMWPSVSTTFFGAFYLGILGTYFLMLRELPDGPWHLLVLYIGTWAYDTGGYFAGSRWGRHRLAPVISPKKSWEGCAGGLVLCALSLALLWTLAPAVKGAYHFTDMMILAALLSFFGQAGDLVESMFKRSLSVKDSGSLFPGHGGVFDRIDSLLFNAPVLFYYIHFLIQEKP